MQLGIMGLGRMGASMARRLMQGGHECVVYDVGSQAVDALVAQGAVGAKSLAPGVDAAPRTPGRPERAGTAEQGCRHCGPPGAGYFVKMVHNGIEDGLRAAYAERLLSAMRQQCGRHAETRGGQGDE